MKHDRTEMVQQGTNRKISKPTAGYRNGKGIWLREMECPQCGARKSPPRNLGDDKKYFCEGAPEAK